MSLVAYVAVYGIVGLGIVLILAGIDRGRRP